MKTFDPNYKLLDEMYQDNYYPTFLVDKVKDELQKVIDLLESGETGTFAVFALGLEGEPWAPLVTEYLDLCDDEHSSLQEKFLHALIRKFGFQPWTLEVLVRGALSMQWLEPAREFRSLIANEESLDALLAVKHRFSAYLLPEENEDPKFRAIAWQSLLWAIWGPASENGGSKAIKTAPKELRERYQEIFQ